VWNSMGIAVILYLLYCLSIKKKTRKVKTYIQEMLEKFGVGFLLSIIVTIIATVIKGDGFAFGYLYVLYAFWMFIHGSAIRFKPLIFGAAVNWAAAITIFIVKDFRYVMLISAVAIAIGYLIPGYLLRRQYKKSNKS
jgi:heme/copper-type cytochrome/quinol oxidase subunit 4